MIASVRVEFQFRKLMEAMNQIFLRSDLDPKEFCEADADKLEAYVGIIRMLLNEKK
jgi:hypothetical protein